MPGVNDEQAIITGNGALFSLGYSVSMHSILFDNSLSAQARMLYQVLEAHYHETYDTDVRSVFPGYDRLCWILGLSRPTVRSCMKELVDAGLVEAKRQGLGKPNVYILTRERSAEKVQAIREGLRNVPHADDGWKNSFHQESRDSFDQDGKILSIRMETGFPLKDTTGIAPHVTSGNVDKRVEEDRASEENFVSNLVEDSSRSASPREAPKTHAANLPAIPKRPEPYVLRYHPREVYEVMDQPVPDDYEQDLAAYAAYLEADEAWQKRWGSITAERERLLARSDTNHVDPALKPAAVPQKKKTKVALAIDRCRELGVEPAIDSRDGKAINECSATAEVIGEAYSAVYRGTWGDSWLKNNLSFRIVCSRISGYLAQRDSQKHAPTPDDPRYYAPGWSQGRMTASEERRVRHG